MSVPAVMFSRLAFSRNACSAASLVGASFVMKWCRLLAENIWSTFSVALSSPARSRLSNAPLVDHAFAALFSAALKPPLFCRSATCCFVVRPPPLFLPPVE
ncbi:hypothetical protein BIM11_5973 [Burkholderia pseudomallei]|nr:hypothetical protein BIM11_5973 [Burkholderia pseudomallei]